ncbi:MAG: hypothetical protein ACE5RP_00210 [Nitrosopumilus sp.]
MIKKKTKKMIGWIAIQVSEFIGFTVLLSLFNLFIGLGIFDTLVARFIGAFILTALVKVGVAESYLMK